MGMINIFFVEIPTGKHHKIHENVSGTNHMKYNNKICDKIKIGSETKRESLDFEREYNSDPE